MRFFVAPILLLVVLIPPVVVRVKRPGQQLDSVEAS